MNDIWEKKLTVNYNKLRTPFVPNLYNICRSSQRSMTVFRNFKNQSQRFMTTFRNFKNQSQCFTTIFGIMHRNKKAEILQGESSALEKIKKRARVAKMDNKRIKVVLVVLNAVKTKYPETKQFIDTTENKCQKERISAEEVIFFTNLEVKSQLRKTFFALQRVC